MRRYRGLYLFILSLLFFRSAHSAVITLSSKEITSGDIFKVLIRKKPRDRYLRVYQNQVRRTVYRVKNSRNLYHFFAGYDIANKVNRMTIKVVSQKDVIKKTFPIKVLAKPRAPQGKVRLKSSAKKKILYQSRSKFSQENQFFHRFFSRETKSQYWTKGWLSPVKGAKVTSHYGKLRKYQNGRVAFHRGVDFAAPIGTKVRAANRGVVVYSGKKRVRGQVVVIDHGMGVFTSYWHLHTRKVRVGKRVSKGQTIGTVGETGLATGPHLHWGVRILNTAVNGLKLLSLK